jgi:hypothetical protein
MFYVAHQVTTINTYNLLLHNSYGHTKIVFTKYSNDNSMATTYTPQYQITNNSINLGLTSFVKTFSITPIFEILLARISPLSKLHLSI